MSKGLTYAAAGVSVDAGNEFVKRIAPFARATYTPRVLAGLGGFAGFFSLDYDNRLFRRRYREPVLVASTDGVGTKLDVAQKAGVHDTVGIDLVAMCVNDLIVSGAEPLFFLDYLLTEHLDVDVAADVVKGISHGCSQAGCALLGGETAEHPGTMPKDAYDLGGFAVGVVEKKRIIDGKNAEEGDVILALASSGLHSNGFSLVRKIVFEKLGLDVADRVDRLGTSVAEALLVPTRIYARAVRAALSAYKVKKVVTAVANITGGGITENVPRVLPADLSACIVKGAWPVPEIFGWLQEAGGVAEDEMYRVFNMGIGMALVVSPYYAQAVKARLEKAGETVYAVGELISTPGRSQVVYKGGG